MRVVTKAKRRIAIALAVLAIAIAAAGCLPDTTGAVGPPDPVKNQIFQELNARRRSAGLPEFGYSPKLDLDGQIWAQSMGQGVGLQHQDLNRLINLPDHTAFWTVGENILNGPWYLSGPAIVNFFMNSQPHRDNILNPNFNVVGIGLYGTPNGQIWISMVFGGL